MTAVSKKRVTWKSLFKEKNFFPSFFKASPLPGKVYCDQWTAKGRYPKHNLFLKKHKNTIKAFADVGCALAAGAPTVFEAKKLLGKNTTIYAVDIKGMPSPKEAAKWKKEGIKPLIHSISKAPLKQKCDAIRFANTSYYMSQSDRRRALVNIWKSLREGGYLLGGVIGHTEFALKKTGKGFELIE
jgi:SAM-dependent methyltransferase